LKANLRGEKGGTFMVGAGRHLASLRYCLHTVLCGPIAHTIYQEWGI